jgi:hypothetical protein
MYALIINDAVERYPYFIDQLFKDNPQVSFPKNPSEELLTEFSVFKITPVDRPKVDHTKDVREEVPQKINGVWTQVWSVYDVSVEELNSRIQNKKEDIRDQRRSLLYECDWVILKSMEQQVSNLEAWKTYRQELRDVPLQIGFPWDVVWPNKPESVA